METTALFIIGSVTICDGTPSTGLQRREELGFGNFACKRCYIAFHSPAQFDQNRESRIVLSTFDAPYVTSIQPGLVSQVFLRHAQRSPFFANSLSKNIEIWIHPPMSRAW